MKNNVNYGVITTSIIGTLFGIGIVSGQEIIQVYLCENESIYMKNFISIFILAIMTYYILKISYTKQPKSFENIIFVNKYLKIALQGFFIVSSLIGMTLMFAGAGALFNSVFNWSIISGSVLIASIVAILGLSGSQTIIKLFRYITPFLIIIAILTSLISIIMPIESINSISVSKVKCMFPNQYITSIIYAFYFIILLIPVLVPIGKKINKPKKVLRDSFLASITLGLGLLLITLAMSNRLSLIAGYDIPMLELAQSINPFLGIIYTMALVGGVIVCPSAILFGMINLFEAKENKYLSNRKIIVLVLCLGALFFSRIGFGKIISLVVPVVGTMGLILSLIIIYRYYKNNF